MGSELAAFAHAGPMSETATHPIARLARCLAALLLVAGITLPPRRALPGSGQTHTRVRPTVVFRFNRKWHESVRVILVALLFRHTAVQPVQPVRLDKGPILRPSV